MNKFTPVNVEFSLRDVGSKIIDQLSTDVYTGPGPIIREVIKNSYDGYLALETDEDIDGSHKRQIIIARDREGTVGRLTIADKGIGQDLEKIKSNVQISISKKSDEVENATGFRGLGSWSVLGAGSRITISSSKKGVPIEFRLTINVRAIYKLLSPKITLDDILNNPKCFTFSQREAEKEIHFTTLEIQCDGPAELVNGHELNRLYPFTDAADLELRKLLIQHAPLPFAAEPGIYEKIREIYSQANYTPTDVLLDGHVLERRLPSELSDFQSHEIEIGGAVTAIAWVVEDPRTTGEIKGIDESKHLLGGPSIQLTKYNVPVGVKGLFSDGVVRPTILNWYVGEVHILAPDVLPSANGQDLRAGTARDAFIQSLQHFYGKLEHRAESKSDRVSLRKKLAQGLEAARGIGGASNATGREDHGQLAKIQTAVRLLEEMGQVGKGKTVSEQKLRIAAKDAAVVKVAKEARKVLKDDGWIGEFGKGSQTNVTKSRKAKKVWKVAASANGATGGTIEIGEFQARIGRAIPRFHELGLTDTQIEGVLRIVGELVG